MEVHHHPDIQHETKKWKEYFLEFLMIFLAVVLGFLSENIREHITDRSKEKQYIAEFIENIKDDTADLRSVIGFDERQVEGINGMLKLAHADMASDSNRKLFYSNALQYLYSETSFKSNDIAFQTLKNTGDFRLIEKDHVADSLTKYDAEIHIGYDQAALYDAYFKDITNRLDEMIDMTVLLDTAIFKNGKFIGKTFPKLRVDNGKLITLFNKIFDFRIIASAYVENILKPGLANANSLLVFLKKEYNIQD